MKKPTSALCSECPLKDNTYLKPTRLTKNLKLVIIGEWPTHTDILDKEQMMGTIGFLLKKNLSPSGIKKDECYLTNAIACECSPQAYSSDEINQARKCCNPRLIEELASLAQTDFHLRYHMTLGEHALRATTGLSNLSKWVGEPLPAASTLFLKCFFVPNYSPRAISPTPHFEPVFRIILRRCLDLNTLRDAWHPPLVPSTSLDAILHSDSDYVGVDVETAGLDPLSVDLICIGLADSTGALSLKWPCSEQDKHTLQAIFDKKKPVMHNGQHDTLSLRKEGFRVNNMYDTLLAHAVVAPKLPHDLGFVTMCEFLTPRWKSEFKVVGDAKGAEKFTKADLTDLMEYNRLDSHNTFKLQEALTKRFKHTHNAEELFDMYMKLSYIAEDMRTYGVNVDKELMKSIQVEYEAKGLKYAEEFRKLVGNIEVNLGASGSSPSLKDLFFKKLKVKPTKYSDTGTPVLDAAILEHICAAYPNLGDLARCVLNYRKVKKLLSTYILGLPVSPDGFVHPTWKVHGARTGRWASSDCNMQNIPQSGSFRSMFIPHPGNVMTACDYSQLELRIVALISGDEELIYDFEHDNDIHSKTAKAFFNLAGSLKDVKTRFKAERDMAKTIEYGVNYNASEDVSTIYKSLVTKYPGITEQMVRFMRKKWFECHPAIKKWQEVSLRQAALHCFVEDPLSGRRQHYHDGEVDPNEVLNYPIQSFAGTLTNRAILKLKELCTKDQHIILQVHDEIVIEGPDVKENERVIKEAMVQTVKYKGNSMTFTVDVHSGKNWGTLKG